MSSPGSTTPADVNIELPTSTPAQAGEEKLSSLTGGGMAEAAAANEKKGKKKRKKKKRPSRFGPVPLEKPLATPTLLSQTALRLELLQLFNTWDTNNDEVLSLLEIVFGLRVRGFSLSPDTLRHIIEDVADPQKNNFTSNSEEVHGHHFLDNESFIEVFTHAELLGKLPTSDAIRVVKLMRDSLSSDSSFAAQLRQCRIKQESLMTLAKQMAKDSSERRSTTDRIQQYKHLSFQAEEKKKKAKRKKKTQRKSVLVSDVYDVAENKTCRSIKRWWNAGSTKPCLAVLVWLFAASFLFTFVNRWGFNEAFYYSVQSGLSVGFGSLSEEKITGRNAFEVCVSAAEVNATARLAALIEQAQVSQDAALRETLAPFANTQEICAYEYTPNPLSLLSMLYTVLHICLGASVIGGALSLFSAMAVESSKAWYDDANSSALTQHKQAQRKNLIRMASQNDGSSSPESKDFNGGTSCWASRWASITGWLREHPAEVKAVTFMQCYAWLGAIVYAVLEDVHWIKGLYFSVAACSTAGLAGPNPTNPGSILFVGLFTLFGVPMYAYTLGIFANGATATYIHAKAMKRRLHVISESEFAAADRLHNGGVSDSGASIDMHEFALLWFLRNQLITPADIDDMHRDFADLDADDDGMFDQSEMQAAMMYAKFDSDGDGELTAVELLPLANALQKTRALSVPDIMLLDPSVPYTEDDIKTVMRAYEDETTVKRVKSKVKIKDKESGKVIVKDELRVHHTFTRKEYMKWWSDEFREYRDKSGDGKAQGMHMRTLQLKAVIDMLSGGESAEGVEKGGVYV